MLFFFDFIELLITNSNYRYKIPFPEKYKKYFNKFIDKIHYIPIKYYNERINGLRPDKVYSFGFSYIKTANTFISSWNNPIIFEIFNYKLHLQLFIFIDNKKIKYKYGKAFNVQKEYNKNIKRIKKYRYESNYPRFKAMLTVENTRQLREFLKEYDINLLKWNIHDWEGLNIKF